ncbi:hypothetical protein [Mesorhizobium tianshanense]|uniref:Uncharacterized protein n=1 Tax=Mesorhizobium tianshanense TaxID=39844 RepID=A0A562P2Z3_9HYPH|nr:hypothetical protein [Mesorhizobium tianshanense]TWI38815.1 hypothetical protein IQ26_02238 [Mesorhizobium tianshanense]
MAKWFEPTGDSYFSHINHQSIEAVIREAKGDQATLAVGGGQEVRRSFASSCGSHLGITTCTAPLR